MVLEINPWFLEGFGIRLEQLVDLFLRRGYQMFRFKDDGNERLEPVRSDQVVEDNYIFIHYDTRNALPIYSHFLSPPPVVVNECRILRALFVT